MTQLWLNLSEDRNNWSQHIKPFEDVQVYFYLLGAHDNSFEIAMQADMDFQKYVLLLNPASTRK